MISLLALAAMAVQGEPLLLDKATPVWTFDEAPMRSRFYYFGYSWWSKTKLVYRRADGSMGQVDIKSRKSATLDAPETVLDELTLSPDHKKRIEFVKWGGEFNRRQVSYRIVDLSGKRQLGAWDYATHDAMIGSMNGGAPFEWPGSRWSKDGKSIYQVESWSRGGRESWLRVVERSVDSLSSSVAFPDAKVDPGLLEFYAEGGRAFVTYDPQVTGHTVKMAEWSLESPATTMKKTILVLPEGLAVRFAWLSPDRRRWLIEAGPAVEAVEGPFATPSLWTCGLHGEKMRELGALHFGSKYEDRAFRFGIVAWNPDSKHVSFVVDKILYLIPV